MDMHFSKDIILEPIWRAFSKTTNCAFVTCISGGTYERETQKDKMIRIFVPSCLSQVHKLTDEVKAHIHSVRLVMFLRQLIT